MEFVGPILAVIGMIITFTAAIRHEKKQFKTTPGIAISLLLGIFTVLGGCALSLFI